jgi:hypothetical protein
MRVPGFPTIDPSVTAITSCQAAKAPPLRIEPSRAAAARGTETFGSRCNEQHPWVARVLPVCACASRTPWTRSRKSTLGVATN